MNLTTIEWVKNVDGSQGYTCNPMTGCLNCIKGKCGGVFPCYAYKQSLGRCYHQDLKGIPVEYYGEGSFMPRIHSQRFDQLYNAPKGSGIFVCDRSDWAAGYWPDWCQESILNSTRKRPDIRLYLLTKQPQELPKFSPFPDNCWVGFSAWSPESFTAGLEEITKVEARIKWCSLEPLLYWGDFNWGNSFKIFDWVVIGALTGTKKQIMELAPRYPALTPWKLSASSNRWGLMPPFAWLKNIVEACDAAGTKVFLKDNLYTWLMECPPEDHDLYWADLANLRQELPEK